MSGNGKQPSAKVAVPLTAKEASLIAKLKQVPFGEVVVVMHEGQPTRINKVTEKIQL